MKTKSFQSTRHNILEDLNLLSFSLYTVVEIRGDIKCFRQLTHAAITVLHLGSRNLCAKILTLLRPTLEQIPAVIKIFVYELQRNTDDLHGLLSSAGIVWVIETCRFKTPEMLRRVNRQRVTEFRLFHTEHERFTIFRSVGEYLPVDNA